MQNNEEYKTLLKLINSTNEKLKNGIQQNEIESFAIENNLLFEQIQQNLLNTNRPYEDSQIRLSSELAILNEIVQQQKLARTLIQAELDRTKSELQRMQSMKKAGHQYQKPTQQEARFVDKTK